MYCRYNKKYILTFEDTVTTVTKLIYRMLNRKKNNKAAVYTAIIC